MAEPITAWTHNISIRHRIGALQLDAAFSIANPWTVLFGPSGSGKTTILRAIAGLLHPDLAAISTTTSAASGAEHTETHVDTSRNIFRPPHLRCIRFAQQRSALFPHMTVLENVLYGIKATSTGSGMPIPELLDQFHIATFADKFPAALSGGEAQRVHLARAVAASGTRLLLLDEPFNGLDSSLRNSLIASLRAWQQISRVPILSVTHDVAEAFQLRAEVVKLSDGRIVDQGPVERVLAEERLRLLNQLNPAAGTQP